MGFDSKFDLVPAPAGSGAPGEAAAAEKGGVGAGEAVALAVGDVVVRGGDWKWGDQDGGGLGTVERTEASHPGKQTSGWVAVRWAATPGKVDSYRNGAQGCFDLALDPAAAKASTGPGPRLSAACHSTIARLGPLVRGCSELLFSKVSSYPYSNSCKDGETVIFLDSNGGNPPAQVKWTSGFTYWVNWEDLRWPKAAGAPLTEGTHPLHPHHRMTLVDRDNGWGCDGRGQPGGCKGVPSFGVPSKPLCGAGRGNRRYRCATGCDFDLCQSCWDVGNVGGAAPAAAPVAAAVGLAPFRPPAAAALAAVGATSATPAAATAAATGWRLKAGASREYSTFKQGGAMAAGLAHVGSAECGSEGERLGRGHGLCPPFDGATGAGFFGPSHSRCIKAGVEVLEIGTGAVPIDLALAGRRAQLLGAPKFLRIADLEPCPDPAMVAAAEVEGAGKAPRQQPRGSGLGAALVAAAQRLAERAPASTSPFLSSSPSPPSSLAVPSSWANQAYGALDYDQSGALGRNDFDLTTRRQAVRAKHRAAEAEAEAAAKVRTALSSSSLSASSDGAGGAAEDNFDDFDLPPPVMAAPKLKATLSVFDEGTDSFVGGQALGAGGGAGGGVTGGFSTFEDEDASHAEGLLALDAAVGSVGETLALPKGSALLLLAACGWDAASAVEHFVADDVAMRRKAGLPLPGRTFFLYPSPEEAAAAGGAAECMVCGDDLPTGHPGPFQCGHVFCDECWEGQLTVKVTERPRGGVGCMWPKCAAVLSEEALESVGVPHAMLRRWRRALAVEFVEANSGGGSGGGGGGGRGGGGGGGLRLVHCKSSTCSAVIRLPPGATGSSVICGECSHTFCSQCDFPAAHAPATCKMVAAWQEKGGMVEASDEDMANWLAIKKMSVRCPKCGHAIIKEPETCNHITCFTSASGCGHHFCYLCSADWDQGQYRCVNSAGKCPSSSSGGGNIYAATKVASASDFDRLNDECAKHIAALRKAQAHSAAFAKALKGARLASGTAAGAPERLATESLEGLANALAATFRYLANAAACVFGLPEGGILRARLAELQAPLQRHAATSLARLEAGARPSASAAVGAAAAPGADKDGAPLSVGALIGEKERLALGATLAAMRKEMERCDAEMQPLIAAHEAAPPVLAAAGAPAAGGAATVIAGAAGPGPVALAVGGGGGGGGGAAAVEEDKIPCELCSALVLASGFLRHVQGHGVTLADGLVGLGGGGTEAGGGGGGGAADDGEVRALAPGFGGRRNGQPLALALPAGFAPSSSAASVAAAAAGGAPLPPGVVPSKPAAPAPAAKNWQSADRNPVAPTASAAALATAPAAAAFSLGQFTAPTSEEKPKGLSGRRKISARRRR